MSYNILGSEAEVYVPPESATVYTVNAVALQLIKLSYQIKAVMPGFSVVRLSSCILMNFVDVLFFWTIVYQLHSNECQMGIRQS